MSWTQSVEHDDGGYTEEEQVGEGEGGEKQINGLDVSVENKDVLGEKRSGDREVD